MNRANNRKLENLEKIEIKKNPLTAKNKKMEKALHEILDRCNNGIRLLNQVLEDKKSSSIEKNRVSYQLTILEMFKGIAEIGLANKSSIERNAENWKNLEEKISKFYGEEDSEGDLADIGELAASAFGFL